MGKTVQKKLAINGKPAGISIEIAANPLSRFLGLIPRRNLPENAGLCITKCDSIHTFFMSFPIDAAFLDSGYRVVRVKKDIKPFRIVLPVRKGKSVIEFAAGTTDKLNVKAGDKIDFF